MLGRWMELQPITQPFGIRGREGFVSWFSLIWKIAPCELAG